MARLCKNLLPPKPCFKLSRHIYVGSWIQQQETTTTLEYILNHPDHEISTFAQRGFSEIIKQKVGKTLHALCIKGLVHLSTFQANTLVSMYSKLGNIDYARFVFDDMPVKDKASWNTMMSGYVKVGLYSKGFILFSEMHEKGDEMSGFLFASVVTACNRAGDMMKEGLQVHSLAAKLGFIFDVFVGTSILHFYGTYGFIGMAKRFFREMPERNVVSWTSLMVGYSNDGDSTGVVNAYRDMKWEGLTGNENTFTTVISSCGLVGNVMLGHQVLGQIIKVGFDTNVSVSNALISMFGAFSAIEQATSVFYHMLERDTISWNSMISAYAQNDLSLEAFRFFNWMRCVHDEIDSTALASLLSACNCMESLNLGRCIHSIVMKLGLQFDVCVCNTLLTMYSDTGKPEDAELLFFEMPDKDLISWNSLMAAYVQQGKSLDVLKLLTQLNHMRKKINHVTFASALSACSNSEFGVEGKIVHGQAILAGLHENLIVGNALVTMYGKLSLMKEARLVLRSMSNQDIITSNALIGGYAENDEPDEAIKAFKMTREGGVTANYITIINILGAFSAPSSLPKHGMPFHAHIIVTGFELYDFVQNSLIKMYAKCGDPSSSNFIFGGLVNKSQVSWNSMVAAHAHHGSGEEALKLFAKMRRSAVELDQFSFSGALAGSANLAVLQEGQQLHSLVFKLGFDSDLHVINAAMDMYGKCGELKDVLKLLPHPVNRSRLSWNILISAFARQGHFYKASEIFHEMVESGQKPDHVTFVSLLSACSHGGLVDEGIQYFDSMTTVFGVHPGVEHCVCIIDLLGRSGRLCEAETFIENMPVLANDLVWRSLLAACRTHGNLELGRKAAKNLIELDPSDDSAYVLYSNMCATTRKWEDVENVRSHMGTKKIKKQPACSWVKLKSGVSSFGMGDNSHPQAKQIYAKLDELKELIKQKGYVADTSFALHDTDEEQKEHNLWNHSERLALAYALINSPEGSTVRIFKNLRVCGDCHSVYKFVSGIVGRQIILRDPYRFHHFSNSECSCSDYW